MVFESFVADLLNKHLGEYVKNLDASQLKIGIWGGDVVLTDLELKDTALSELDLPIKVVKGFLGKLILQIPWKNLYTEPTTVKVEDLHLLVKSNDDIKYDEEKEENAKWEQKKTEIRNIEEARERDERKRSGKKEKPEDEDSFTEKLATSIVKNLQISIQHIHIRYEDSVSDPISPFSIGVTLENLSAETTDENFKPQIIKDTVTIIHKLIRLDNLAVYWNPNDSFRDMSTDDWLKFSRDRIACYNSTPVENNISMNYIIKPLVASKKMKINTKPGIDKSIPKFFLSLVLEELGVLFMRRQFLCMVNLIGSIERMQKNQPYRKYRPHEPPHDHAKEWWTYCISSVLEVDVRRYTRMWSWEYMKEHRKTCKQYKESYKEKLLHKSPSKDLLETLDEMEKKLNVVSITIFRQLAESEAAQIKKMKKAPSKSKGWFSGWFSSAEPKNREETKVISSFDELFPSEAEKEKEMQKLYQSIGYTENEVITPFSADYVALVFKFQLSKISIKCIDDTKGETLDITCFSLNRLHADVSQRPSSKGLKVSLKIDQLKLLGTPHGNKIPTVIRSYMQDEDINAPPLVDLSFEINPLDKDVDQSIKAVSQPLEFIYDEKSINSILSFFEPPEEIVLKDLQEKAYLTFEDLKVSSTVGLVYAMEQKNTLDVDIYLNASYLIIPEKGSYFDCNEFIVVDFGSLELKSDPTQERVSNIKEFDFKDVQENAYDRFLLNLTSLQVLICHEGEDIQNARTPKSLHCNVLHPVAFVGKIAKAIVPEDPRLKQFSISGELPSLEVTVSDGKISRIVKLFDSLSIPGLQKEEESIKIGTEGTLTHQNTNYTDLIIPEGLEIHVPEQNQGLAINDNDIPPDKRSLKSEGSMEEEYVAGIVNQIKVELKFDIKKLILSIALTDKQLLQEKDCISLNIDDISCDLKVRRWDMFCNATIGHFELMEMTHGIDGDPLKLLYTEKDCKMLSLSYKNCGFNEVLNLGASYIYSSEYQIRALQYREEFQGIEQYLKVEMSMLFVKLHQEALLNILAVIHQVLEPFSEPEVVEEPVSDVPLKRRLSNVPDIPLKRRLSSVGEEIARRLSSPAEMMPHKKKEAKKKKSQKVSRTEIGLSDGISLKIVAKMAGLDVHVCSTKVNLAQATVTGLSAHIEQYEKRLEVQASMSDLQVHDMKEFTKYPHIILMESEQVFSLKFIMFEDGTKEKNSLNMSAFDTLIELNVGQMKAIFLNRFIRDILAFINHFEDAKNAILEASEAARQKAVDVVQEHSRHSERHKFDLTLHAPTIIIPADSKSVITMFVYLGKLHVNNDFKVVTSEVKSSRDYVITDNINISLTELKVSKALLDTDNNVSAQRNFIEPLALKLKIIRNLTFENHLLPDLSIEGSLNSITIYLSQEEVTVIMKILNQNISEGAINVPSAPPQKQKKNAKESTYISTVSTKPILERRMSRVPVPGGSKSLVLNDSSLITEVTTYIKTKFTFDLEKVVLKIYQKPTDITFEDEFLERDEEFSLSEFIIGHLNVSGSMLSNEQIDVSVLLQTLILDDKRMKSKGKLTRMVDHCPKPILENKNKEKATETKSMLQIDYTMTESSDHSINIQLCNLLCILNMEFIMVLTNTMLAMIPGQSMEHGESISSLSSSSYSLESSYEDSDSPINISADYADEEIVSRSEIRLIFNLQNPQIVLLADARDPKTHGLFLTMQTRFQYFYLTHVQKMVMNVNHISILSTAFHEENRSDISTVLSLEAIDFFSSAPIDGKPHMNVSMTSVDLNISPLTINTVLESIKLAAQYKSTEDEDDTEKAFSELWHLKDITEKKAWYLDIPPQHVLSAGSFVLARNEENTYKNGFLSKKDTHFTVFFYPEGQISHSVSDVTSVVVDMVPGEDKIAVGANVLAMYAEVGYKVGQVIRIWQSRKTSKGSAGGSTSPQNTWDTGSDDGSLDNKYLIHFYHNDSEFYLTNLHIRLLPLPTKGVVPGIGACVYARFKDGSYYKGIIKSIHGYQIEVHFNEIDEKISHDRDDTAAIILNVTPQESQVKKLFKVIAIRSKTSKDFHPGKVLTIIGNPGNYSYYIKFEDGSTNQVPLSELRLMPKAPYDALPEIGSYVYSRIGKDSPVYEKGIVADRNERLFINHLSGRKLSHDIQNIGYVVRNIVPLNASLMVGQDVIGQVDNDDMYMSMGVIKEVIIGQKHKKYLIEFTDGAEKRLTAGRIRILSTYGATQTENDEANILQIRKEQLVFEVEKISFNLQGYLGGVLTSFLHFHTKLNAQVHDWSGKLNGCVNLSLHATYYNDQVAEWEPLVEPISENNQSRDWALSLKYTTEDDDVQNSESVSDETALLQKPITSLSVTSIDNLNITLTDESISMVQELTQVFNNIVKSPEVGSHAHSHNSPYVVYNRLGIKVTIQMNELLQGVKSETKITVDSFSDAGLEHKDSGEDLHVTRKLPNISVQVEGYQELKHIVVKRQRLVLYNLVPLNLFAGEPFSVVIQVEVSEGRRFITIRSPLQLKNNFPISLDVRYMNKDREMTKLTTIDAHTKYAVPLLPAYHSKLHFTPSGFGYQDSTDSFDWKNVGAGKENQLVCMHTDEGTEPFYIQTVTECETYTSVHGMMGDIPHCTVNCYPPIILHNYLPYNVLYKSKGMAKMEKLEGGKNWPLFSVNVDERPVIDIIIEDYMGYRWVGNIVISGTKGKTSRFVPFTLRSAENRKLDLGVFQLQEGTLNVTFYSHYWMVNKTGQTLIYQDAGNESMTQHPNTFPSPVMFQVKGKKKKARLSIPGCNWSDEFSLDTVGSDGSLESAGVRGRIFEIGVRISLSNFALTKIVTFTPLRMINNLSKYTISMAESDSETSEWHTVKADESIPYWPTCLPPKNLYININGTDSVHFNPEAGKTLLLKFQNEIGGICVTYQEKDSSSLLSFDTYFAGSAPARIENMCKQVSMISYQQTGFQKGHVLLYGQSVLYSWDDPTQTQELICGIIEHNESRTNITLDKHDFGRMKAGNSMIYWVSFLDGIQRVLLFTDNFKAAYYASQEHIMRPSQAIDINIESIGISLVNTEKRLEVGYISIRKSPIVWEYSRKNRMKKLENKMSVALEEGYTNYQHDQTAGKVKVLDVEVDYDKMFITKPEKIKIQRIFHSGIEFNYTLFPNRMSISGSVSTLQVDCHIPGTTFPTIIHIVEPPMSVARDNIHKPFIDFSLITKLGEKSTVNEVNYFMVLVQEVDIRIDTLFLYALYELLTPEKTKESETEQYKSDLLFVEQSLENSPEYQATKQEKRYVFNYFHVSPLKIHVSFSFIIGQDDDDETEGSSVKGDILSLLLQSVGLAITEIQGVEFKLACYEINSSLLSYSQLSDAISKYYQAQAIKQLYVLVLGLDVIGNPYELITGVGAGAKSFFYEPYQGLIQGPEEFAEGLAYGVKSLVGGTVGGVSGAVSKITGTFGKGLAALTMDDEFQQHRRQAMSQRPTNLGQGLVKGGKGLFKGIVSGVTGIVTKPIEGAKADGAGGFFKGIGKGLIGVVARPAGGVVDLASNTFEGLKSTTTGAQTILRVRENRVFFADKILRPYNTYEAEGNKVFMKTDKGSWAKTDMYMVHVYPTDNKNYLILTNQHILYVTQTDILNDWETDWHLSFHEIKGEPIADGSSITFNMQVTQTRVFKKTVKFRKVNLPSASTVKWFLSKLEDMKLY